MAWSDKDKARDALKAAVKSGKVLRPDACEACGAKCIPEGHHADYDRPLDVRWLCSPCHAIEHGYTRAAINVRSPKRTPTVWRFDPVRMRRLRDAKGLSRDALAALCPNVSAAAIRTYEAGGHVPDVDRALQIARALGVTVEKLSAPTIEGAPRDTVQHPEGAAAR